LSESGDKEGFMVQTESCIVLLKRTSFSKSLLQLSGNVKDSNFQRKAMGRMWKKGYLKSSKHGSTRYRLFKGR